MPTSLHLDGFGAVTAIYPDDTARRFESMIELCAALGVEVGRVVSNEGDEP